MQIEQTEEQRRRAYQDAGVPYTPPVRNVQPQSGPPITFDRGVPVNPPSGGYSSSYSSSSSSSSGGGDGSEAFGLALMNLLKQHQQLGTKGFATQELDARKAQQNRILAQSPDDLLGANPNIQNSVRNAAAGALDPTIAGAVASQRTFSEQLGGFSDALDSARNLLKDYESTQAQKRDDARQVVQDLIKNGQAQNLDPNEVSRLEKLGGYPKGYVFEVSRTVAAVKNNSSTSNTSSSSNTSPFTTNQSSRGIPINGVFVGGSSGNTSLPPYEQWVRPYLATPAGKALVSKVGGDNIRLAQEARKVYASLAGGIKTQTTNTISLGKLTPSQTQKITQAGLSGSDNNTKAFYLSTEPAFQTLWIRNIASGKGAKPNLSQMQQLYTEWQSAKTTTKKTGSFDFDSF